MRRYLGAMERNSLDGVLECFAPDGIVESPIYGAMPAKPFYEKLFADTTAASVNISTIYESVDVPDRAAAHFTYYWKRRDGTEIDTRLVDLFEFQPGGEKISRLTIVYDNPPKRAA